jgi:hypothetical protein
MRTSFLRWWNSGSARLYCIVNYVDTNSINTYLLSRLGFDKTYERVRAGLAVFDPETLATQRNDVSN